MLALISILFLILSVGLGAYLFNSPERLPVYVHVAFIASVLGFLVCFVQWLVHRISEHHTAEHH